MVQVPMQDAGRAKLRELAQIEAQGPRRQVEAPGDLHEVGERRALERHREAPPQAREIDAMAVVAGDHADAREAALRGLGLQEYRQSLAGSELKPRHELHHARPARLSSGSKIHSISRRRSSRTSASTCMPGCNGSSRP